MIHHKSSPTAIGTINTVGLVNWQSDTQKTKSPNTLFLSIILVQYDSFWPISFFFLFSKKIYCYSITLVCIFSPSFHPPPSELTTLRRLHLPPRFCPCVLYSSYCKPLSPLFPTHSPLPIFRLSLTSKSVVTFFLLFFFC